MTKKRKRKKSTLVLRKKHKPKPKIPSLSEEIIFKILARVSAEFCHDKGRLVSKSWASIISTNDFIETHLSLSNPSFFLDDSMCVKLKSGFVQDTVRPIKQKKATRILLASSDGCLLYIHGRRRFLYVKNPVTRKILILPRFRGNILGATLLRISHSRQFKVVCQFESPIHLLTVSWAVLTIGTDMSWTSVSGLDFRIGYMPPFYIHYKACLFSVGDLVVDFSEWYKMKRFLVIDLYDNSLHLVHRPPVEDEKTLRGLFPSGRCLYTVSISSTHSNVYNLCLWKMGDFRSSEWEEVFSGEVSEEMGSELRGKGVFFNAWLENHKILMLRKISRYGYSESFLYEFGLIRLRERHCLPIGVRTSYVRGKDRSIGPQLWNHNSSLISW